MIGPSSFTSAPVRHVRAGGGRIRRWIHGTCADAARRMLSFGRLGRSWRRGRRVAAAVGVGVGGWGLVGRRAAAGLKVFLAAVAIADDLGAVLVIAFFFTAKVSVVALAWAAGFLAALVVVNRTGVRRGVVYA